MRSAAPVHGTDSDDVETYTAYAAFGANPARRYRVYVRLRTLRSRKAPATSRALDNLLNSV